MRGPGHVLQVDIPGRALRRRLCPHPRRPQEENHREPRGLPKKGTFEESKYVSIHLVSIESVVAIC